MDNQITHNGNTYTVKVVERKAEKIGHIYKPDARHPFVGTPFSPSASFQDDIMAWAWDYIKRNF
jgi:hypothetical protein